MMKSAGFVLGLAVLGSVAHAESGSPRFAGAEVLGRYRVDGVRNGAVTWHEPREDQFLDECHPTPDSTGYVLPANEACQQEVWVVRKGNELAMIKADRQSAPSGVFKSFLFQTKALFNKWCIDSLSSSRATSDLFGSRVCRAYQPQQNADAISSNEYYFFSNGDSLDPYKDAEVGALFSTAFFGLPIGTASAFRVTLGEGATPASIAIEERRMSILIFSVKTIHRYQLKRIGD